MNQYNENHLIVWDLETTGFVENPDACIIEIGAMVFDTHADAVSGTPWTLVSEHSWILQHHIDIPEKITEITGITREIIDAEGREAIICLREFTDLLVAVIRGGGMHLTHNGFRFDIPFLVKQHAAFQVMDLEYQREFRSMLESSGVDTAVFVKAMKLRMTQHEGESFKQFADRVMNVIAKGVKYNVGICCDEMGIDRSAITQHRANADVFLTSEIFKHLIKTAPGYKFAPAV